MAVVASVFLDSTPLVGLLLLAGPTIFDWAEALTSQGGVPPAPLVLQGLFTEPFVQAFTLVHLSVSLAWFGAATRNLLAPLPGLSSFEGFITEPFSPAQLSAGLATTHPTALFFTYGLILSSLLLPTLGRLRPVRGLGPDPLYGASFTWASVAISLGALWSAHELNWGGWWAWDMVEVGSLFLLLPPLAGLHSLRHSTPSNVYAWPYLGLFYLGVHCQVFPSIHNFVGSHTVHESQFVLALCLVLPHLWCLVPPVPQNPLNLIFSSTQLCVLGLIFASWLGVPLSPPLWLTTPAYLVLFLMGSQGFVTFNYLAPTGLLSPLYGLIKVVKGRATHIGVAVMLVSLPLLRLDHLGISVNWAQLGPEPLDMWQQLTTIKIMAWPWVETFEWLELSTTQPLSEVLLAQSNTTQFLRSHQLYGMTWQPQDCLVLLDLSIVAFLSLPLVYKLQLDENNVGLR